MILCILLSNEKKMAIYVYTDTPGEEEQPLIPGDYTLLR